jgi:hypothetical protein
MSEIGKECSDAGSYKLMTFVACLPLCLQQLLFTARLRLQPKSRRVTFSGGEKSLVLWGEERKREISLTLSQFRAGFDWATMAREMLVLDGSGMIWPNGFLRLSFLGGSHTQRLRCYSARSSPKANQQMKNKKNTTIILSCMQILSKKIS